MGRSARDVGVEERVALRWDRWQMINDVAADRGGLGERVASGAHWVHDGGQWRQRLAKGAYDARGAWSDDIAKERLSFGEMIENSGCGGAALHE